MSLQDPTCRLTPSPSGIAGSQRLGVSIPDRRAWSGVRSQLGLCIAKLRGLGGAPHVERCFIQ